MAIDVDAGRRVVFEAGGPASLIDAVEASCAVPGVWPVVTIDGQRYMDGGIPSPANVAVAGETKRIVVIAPLRRGAKRSSAPQREQEALGVPGCVVSPDDEAQAAMGSDVLNPSARAAAAQAGLAQAARVAEAIAAVW